MRGESGSKEIRGSFGHLFFFSPRCRIDWVWVLGSRPPISTSGRLAMLFSILNPSFAPMPAAVGDYGSAQFIRGGKCLSIIDATSYKKKKEIMGLHTTAKVSGSSPRKFSMDVNFAFLWRGR